MRTYMKYLFLIVLVCFFIYLFYAFSDNSVIRSRKILLQQTDYHELLKAGRELISEIVSEDIISNYDRQKNKDIYIPEDVNIPEAINTLCRKLSGFGGEINIYHNSCLMILFSERETGCFGVLIFSDGYEEPEGFFIRGDKMLIPGLWYFDDCYDKFGPKYVKKIEKIIQENKYLNEYEKQE